MDITSLLGTVVSQDSLNQISRAADVPTKDVQSVLMSALPSLLGGALNQANDASTASSFAGALNQHAASNTSNLGSFLSSVDLDDGAKIIGHLLGGNSNAVAQQAAAKSGLSLGQTLKILSIAAPLVMSLLGKTAQSQQQAQTQSATLQPLQPQPQQSGSGLDISSILGALLKNIDIGKLLISLLK
jgi:hypothetical protein